MERGEYTSIGAERGERGGRHRGGRGGRGERGERGDHRRWSGGGWGGWGGWGGGWGGWPYYSSRPYYSSYAWPYNYGYAQPAYDITEGGHVYNTGQFYVPSYGPSWPSYALPFYGAATAFPHWQSRRFAMHRHRRRLHHILGQEVDF